VKVSGPFEYCPYKAGVARSPLGALTVRPGQRFHDIQAMGPVVLLMPASPWAACVLAFNSHITVVQLDADLEMPTA
jgi:hypothetical protein